MTASIFLFFFSRLSVMPRGCPNDCSNRGICSQGVCDCLNGLTGKDCSSGESLAIVPAIMTLIDAIRQIGKAAF